MTHHIRKVSNELEFVWCRLERKDRKWISDVCSDCYLSVDRNMRIIKKASDRWKARYRTESTVVFVPVLDAQEHPRNDSRWTISVKQAGPESTRVETAARTPGGVVGE